MKSLSLQDQKAGWSWLVFVLLLLAGISAQAADYNFSDGALRNLPAGCSGSAGSYSCAALSLAAGESISIAPNQPTTITFSGAFDTGGGVLINAGGSTPDFTMVVNGAVTLGTGSILTGNLSTLGAGAVTVGIESWISGNVSTEIGFVVMGAATSKTGVGGNISTGTGYVGLGAGAIVGGTVNTVTGYVGLGAGATVGGAVTTTTAGYVSLGAGSRINGNVSTGTAGSVILGAGSTVYGSIAVHGTTGADYITTGDSSKITGSISTAGSYVTLGANTQVGGSVTALNYVTVGAGVYASSDITSTAGYVTVGAGSTVLGQVSSYTSYIWMGAGAQVHAVCCHLTDGTCLTDTSLLTPVPLICVPSSPPSSNAARLDCMESGSSLPARLFTKLAGRSFAFDVVALKTDGTLETQFVAGSSTKNVTLELVDGTLAAGCALQSPILSQTLSFTATDAGRKTAVALTVGNAYANLRCRVTDGSTTQTCSSDNFAVRPAAFLVSKNTPTLVAGSTFTLQATAVMSDLTSTATNYAGSPTLNPGAMSGFTSTALAPNAFVAATNGSSSAIFTYDEVGSFTLPASSVLGITDSSFTTVDGSTDCNANSASNTLDSSGKYGCSIGQSALLTVGPFYPDHFDITPVFTPACAVGGFTYMGQDFTLGYTVTAKSLSRASPNAPGNQVLKLYSGGQLHLIALNAGVLVPGLTPAVTPTATWSNGSYTTTSTGTKFARPTTSTPDATWGPYEALNIGVAVDDADGAAFASTVSTFGGTTPASCVKPDAIACKQYASLTGGAVAKMLMGRIRLKNAYGSERGPLDIPMAFEYWASNGWRKNPLDTCSGVLLKSQNFGFEFPGGSSTKPNNLQACDTAITIAPSGAPATFPYALTLATPGSGKSGWTDITLNLGATSTGTQCKTKAVPGSGLAATTAATATATPMLWLQNNNTNPKARATFGMFKSPLIYRRESY